MDYKSVPTPVFGRWPNAISDNLRVAEKLNAKTIYKEITPLAMAA